MDETSEIVITPVDHILTDIISNYSGDSSSDECLARVFQCLAYADRKSCSLVGRRWLVVEGQSRRRLSLNARSALSSFIPSLFTRYDSITELVLKCKRGSTSIRDDDLLLISLRCRNLIRLKLHSCREITDAGLSSFAKNRKNLKKFSCRSCLFGARGVNAILDHCSFLEQLSVKRLRGSIDEAVGEPIGPGVVGASLKFICLKELYNAQCFQLLITESKNVTTLKLVRCSGDWDKLFESDSIARMVEIHLERIQVSDRALAAISKCVDLEVLNLIRIPECTNAALVLIAKCCKLLRKLHIDGWKTYRIGDKGLSAIAEHCLNLQELVLVSVVPSNSSLGLLGNCPKLENLALCGSETIGDSEISCIASKCRELRKLCIKSCPISDHAMEALAKGFPKLIKLKVKNCRGVTIDGVSWLRSSRQSLVVNSDNDAGESSDISTNDCEEQIGAKTPMLINQVTDSIDVPSDGNAQSSVVARLGCW